MSIQRVFRRALRAQIAAAPAARATVDWRRIVLAADAIRLGHGQRITLNGLAQGYVTDRIADLLRARGFAHVLVDLGEQRALGPRRPGVPWLIAREGADPIARRWRTRDLGGSRLHSRRGRRRAPPVRPAQRAERGRMAATHRPSRVRGGGRRPVHGALCGKRRRDRLDPGVASRRCRMGDRPPRIRAALAALTGLTGEATAAPPAPHFFLPSAANWLRKSHRSPASFSLLIPTNTILVLGILAFGSLMYSLNVASLQVIPEFLLAAL